MADQLRASYSSQLQSHKWWHHIFWFFLDMTIVNMYILYLSHLEEERRITGVQKTPISHLKFKTNLCAKLTQNWPRRDDGPHMVHGSSGICIPKYSKKRRQCVVCVGQHPLPRKTH